MIYSRNHDFKKINCNFIEGQIVLFQYFIFLKKTPKITIFMIDSYLFEILSKKNRISNVQDIKKNIQFIQSKKCKLNLFSFYRLGHSS